MGFLVIFARAKWDGCVNNRNVQSVKSAPFQLLYSSPSRSVSVPIRLDSSLVALQGALQVLLRPETGHI